MATKPKESEPHPYSVRIYNLLLAGWYPAQIASHLLCSESLVRKYARRYEGEGLIERISRTPAFWRAKQAIPHPYKSNPSSAPFQVNKPLLYPHKLGASFYLIGNPRLRKDSRGIATIKEPNYTVRLGNSKAVIWVKSFTGSTVQEQLLNGRQALIEVARELSAQYSITLTLDRVYEGVDWVLGDKKGSKVVGEGADLKSEPKLIAGANMKFDDATHPAHLEVEPAPSYAPSNASEVARRLEFLILSAPSFNKSFEAISRYDANVNKHLEVLTAIGEQIGELASAVKKLKREVKKVKPSPLTSGKEKHTEPPREFYR